MSLKKKIFRNLLKVRIYIYDKQWFGYPVCVLCQKSLGNDSMKPSLLTRHLERAHPEFKDKELTFSSIENQCLRNNAWIKVACFSNKPMLH